MKSYTDIEQSKKLAEILPFESADYHYIAQGEESYIYPYSLSSDAIKQYNGNIKYIPCWSLAALLDVLPKHLDVGRPVLATNYRGCYWVVYFDEYMKETNLTSKIYDNPIDACCEMIIKPNEQNIL